MKLAFDTVDLEDLSIDPSIQMIREPDHVWVSRFVDLYEDDADMPPLLVMEDDESRRWLVDGFRRWRACTRVGRQGHRAEVRHGSLEMARFAAAGVNKASLLPEEQRRALALALTTPEGRKLSHKDLARHIGVPRAFVETYVSGGATVADKRQQTAANFDAAIREALVRSPQATTKQIAKDLGIDKDIVRHARSAMGFKSLNEISAEKLARAERLWRINSDILVSEMHVITKSTYELLQALRDRMGIPAQPKGSSAKAKDKSRIPFFLKQEAEAMGAESAPTRKSSDPRANSSDKILYMGQPSSRVLGAMAAVEQLDAAERSRFADIISGRWPGFFATPSAKSA